MAFKSILTVTLGSTVRPEALDAAIALAAREGGHLDVLCLGVDRVQVGYYFDTASPALVEEGIARAKGEAAGARDAVEARLQNEDIPWSVRAAVVQIGAIPDVVGHIARFNDLVILPKPYGDDREVEDVAVLESALFEGRTPVLVMPDGPVAEFGRNVVIGWNESVEALSAIRTALPVLKAADRVDVSIIGPDTHAPDQSDPGADLCRMLSRHGVEVQATVLAKTTPRVSDTLLRHAADEGADLIVMGAYGHSRFREAILGGATRNLLETTSLPIFMSH